MNKYLAVIVWQIMSFGLISCATTSRNTVYLIKLEDGDTLSKIATKYDTTWQQIAKLNNIEPGTSVKSGTVLKVAPGPGGIIASKTGKGRLSRSAKNTNEEDDHPDLEQEGDGDHRGLFFNNGSGSTMNWPVYGKISSTYGQRGRHFHHGIDIRAKRGTKVYAASSGIVEFSGRQNGYGNIVIVKHNKVKTAYAHLNRLNVSAGQKVAGNTIIGEVGNTGNSSGPHLHFELRTLSDKSMNPYSVLDTKQLLSEK